MKNNISDRKSVLLIFVLCGCFLALVGCGDSDQENNKFVGVWSRREYGYDVYCCISPSGIGYICNAQGDEMSVEDKNIYEYEIDGDTISLTNEKFNCSFRLKGDTLVRDDGEEYQRSYGEIRIYKESEDGEGPEEFLETVKGQED